MLLSRLMLSMVLKLVCLTAGFSDASKYYRVFVDASIVTPKQAENTGNQDITEARKYTSQNLHSSIEEFDDDDAADVEEDGQLVNFFTHEMNDNELDPSKVEDDGQWEDLSTPSAGGNFRRKDVVKNGLELDPNGRYHGRRLVMWHRKISSAASVAVPIAIAL